MEKLIPICENRDFRRIYARGKSVVTPQIVIYISKNRQKTLRIGITTSKKIGNAVMRNRSRRIIREAFREISPQIKRGYDIILVARGKTPYLKSTDVKNQLIRQLSKEKLFVNAELTGDVNIWWKRYFCGWFDFTDHSCHPEKVTAAANIFRPVRNTVLKLLRGSEQLKADLWLCGGYWDAIRFQRVDMILFPRKRKNETKIYP